MPRSSATQSTPAKPTPTSSSLSIWVGLLILTVLGCGLVFLLNLKTSIVTKQVMTQDLSERAPTLPPFPVGVDPIAELITEDPAVDSYVEQFVASNHTLPRFGDSWLDRVVTKLAMFDWYQNLATPDTRILVIQSGERQEEIHRNIARVMGWDASSTALFKARVMESSSLSTDGTLYPGRYVVARNADPETVAVAITERFNAEVLTRYPQDIETTLPLSDILTIASLIEREAYDFNDMRYISGVIWNRLFSDMRLQIDATLQYARASDAGPTRERGWWPVPLPSDKYIDSPYNTYKHGGLPPGPISNPSVDAIIAALNPRNTNCLFYYHTDDGTFYCNETYEAHVAGLRLHFGTAK